MAQSPKSSARPVPARRKPARRSDAAKSAKSKTPATAAGGAGVLAWSLGGLALAAGAGLIAFLTRGRVAAVLSIEPAEGHVPSDLMDPDHAAGDRAPAAFRPDMAAPMTAGERAALAPATGPAPSLVAERGTMNSQTS